MKNIITIQKIIKTIKKNKLINKGDRVLIALSGGADSVFLLNALLSISESLDFEIGACHIEHGIRGENSLRDMEFSKKICENLGLEFFCGRFSVPEVAKTEKLSVEAAGRKVRYEFFAQIMEENNYNLLATAHHRNDKTETVVMNFLRGCSLRGFSGIEYKNKNVIRPLLDIEKSEILEFLSSNNINFCIDETNSDESYTRNKIRHSLIPSLKEFNPSFEEALLRQSNIFSDEDDYMNIVSLIEYSRCVTDSGLDIKKLGSCHRAILRRVIYRFLSSVKGTSADITASDVEASLELCLKGETGKRLNLSNGIEVCIEYGCFCVSDSAEIPDFSYSLKIGETVFVPEIGLKFTLLPDGGIFKISENDLIEIRNRRDGDAFYPVGMVGQKKLKKFFIDSKIPARSRDTIPLLVINGDIASVIGLRDDRRFSGTGGTCRILTENI